MLSKEQHSILDYLYNNEKCYTPDIELKFNCDWKSDNRIHSLIAENFISYNVDSVGTYIYITDKGKAETESKKETDSEKSFYHFHEWANTIIAITALIVAIIALFKK